MRYGRRDDLVLEYRNAWTAWGNTYPTTEVLREQGFYTALDPEVWTDMYWFVASPPNDVQIVVWRSAYVDDTYMCWAYASVQGRPCTWDQPHLVRGEIDAE